MDEHRDKMIVITGPTATGKTLLGVRVAKELGGEVVSSDSMQIYKDMNIGTAKPTPDEMDGIPHHMTDIVPPHEDYSVARYVREASACIDDIISRGRQPIVVGGAGLYIDSLIRGRVFSLRGDPKLRRELEAQYDEQGGEAMLHKLEAQDAESAKRLFPNDKKRIVRALETVMTTGIPLSRHDAEEKTLPDKYNAVKFALNFCERAVLYDRINKRVDAMVAAGLVDEVAGLLEAGVPRTCTAMQAIGYKEIADALVLKTNIGEAVDKIKMESRRYAKRQLTWLRRDESVRWIMFDKEPDIEVALNEVTDYTLAGKV